MTAIYETALFFATRAHGDQKRWNGDPYITHPIRVAARVEAAMRGMFAPEHIAKFKAVAALHDTLEDTEADALALSVRFGKDVSEAVEILSRLGEGEDKASGYAGYIDRVIASGNELALRVKLADLEDNLALPFEGWPDGDLGDPSKGSLRNRYTDARWKVKKVLP